MITSLQNKQIKDLIKLKQKKYRQESFICFNKELIKKAFSQNKLIKLFYLKEPLFDFENSYQITREVKDKITDYNTEYIAIIAKIKETNELGNYIVATDNLQDPSNIGRIMHYLKLFNFNGLLLSNNCADIYNQKTIENAKEVFFDVNLKHCNLKEELLKLKEVGYQILVTGLSNNDIFLDEVQKSNKVVVVLGNEGSGVSQEIMEIADQIVKIKMANIDSLNVSIAGAIIMSRLGNI